ncbi:epoxyqueuosine reductase [Anaerosolibacter carboniphilus]|uniref:Epoxyqueuosine reductase n=1 Tax=Anaerosolibacter carboniphilus TaxID=1417629 RepID=A0A841KMF8_9FIRM|nr:tRNA epoxyqueuosine(34) reductase QueG [Anaerosolibacter carboniphilus]MBB6214627.1 epoxyqueuosine reductase [Anaerosolibacter carboniphilus]
MMFEDKIRSYGKSIGIDLIGFTTIEPFERIGNVQRARHKKGHLSGFEEHDLDKRMNPLITMENAKSIIAIGIGYYHGDETPMEEPYGEITRSAWGKDYHHVLMEKFLRLMSYIKESISDFEYKAFVDTGPLSDREVAYRAGLGWFGKNNMLITKDFGSWVFLGYALTNLFLTPDQPMVENCLGCNLCIEACPGGALEDGYGMNARKCLSYITQTKEEIEEETREKMGNAIYGCDVCQNVCPHNRPISHKVKGDFIPEGRTHRPHIGRLIQMSNKEFKALYKDTAAGWRGKNNLRRNAIIAAGNAKDPGLLPYLMEALKDDSIMIRKYAVWAIHKIGWEGKAILEQHLRLEKDQEIIKEIIRYLEGE